MALTNNVEKLIFLNISKGYFVKSINKDETYKELTGTIISAHIKSDFYKQQEYKVCLLKIIDESETYILSLKCDSMYFKSLCNSLKSSDIDKPVTIKPSYNEHTNKSTCFVIQYGKSLKWFHTLDKPGDMPITKKHEVNGKIIYDSTDQTEYWINWIKNIKFKINE